MIKTFSWIIFICIILFLGLNLYFWSSFSLFDEPRRVNIFDLYYKKQKYTVVSVFGNAVTNGSVQLFKVDYSGNDELKHKGFLSSNFYYEKGLFAKLNDSIFQCVFIDGRDRKDTVLLNMKTKKMNYLSYKK